MTTDLGGEMDFDNLINHNTTYTNFMKFRCFFHNLTIPPKTTEEEILRLFLNVEKETQEKHPFYSNQYGYKVLLRNEKKYVNSDATEYCFLGKMVKSEKEIDYGEEKEGNLGDFP